MPNYKLKVTSNGGLYPERNRKHDKAPHFKGFVNITRDQAKHIAQHFKQDGSLDKLRVTLAAWKNQGENGVQLSIQSETYPPDDVSQAGDEPRPGQGMFTGRQTKVAEPKPQSEDPFDDLEEDIPF